MIQHVTHERLVFPELELTVYETSAIAAYVDEALITGFLQGIFTNMVCF
jgi:hypothetical protein